MQNMMDDIKKVVTSTTQKAVQKSGELYERSKIMLAITAAQNDIDREYSAIGKLIYAGYQDDDVSSEDVQAKCQLIDEKMNEITALRERLAQVKNIKVCPACKAEVSGSSTYCAKCGEKLQ